MKKVGYFKSISKTFVFAFFFVLAVTSMASAQEGDAAKGKELFNANCAACHKLDAKATGPALRGVANKYDKAWLYKWINNSSALIKSGDAKAIKIFEEYNKSVMTAFPNLSTADIDNIIAYTDEKKAEAPTATAAVPGPGGADSGLSNNVILGALALVMLMLVSLLLLLLVVVVIQGTTILH